MAHQWSEDSDRSDVFGRQSSLEAVVGFKIAEETYDMLTFREQIIIDLLMCDFSQNDIAIVFGVSQPSICSSIRRIRTKLAQSKLKTVMDIRIHYKEEAQRVQL